ncbi:MAG TPA: GerMN domain-containing protein [Candidatus Limivivens intestinipullorum]|uniref:GerMN domain-containing protein n=1 Tax=Candidatus Limivivens intestinipullorum TaxID=2840858 RepID=A0A9D1EVE7_9FIRM|nr:GerMN domain-containing protein [Candidatus Limivivens intestinipullorum]
MKRYIGWILACLASLLLSGCASGQRDAGGYQINYVNTSGTRLVEESYTASETEGEPLARELLDRMRVPQYSGDYHSAIPDTVEVLSLSLAEENLTLDFGEAYYEMDNITEILMRTAVVETLTQVAGVSTITFTVEGNPLTDSMGAEVGRMTSDMFIDTRGEGINSYQYASLTLYFASGDGTKLQREMRNIYYSTNTSMERVVVEELLEGPANPRLGSIAASSTKILGTTVKDGVCTINFDNTFNQNPGSGVSPETAIYAIVNALSDNCGVTSVVFQINGSSDVLFRDSVSLAEPFTRNDAIVETVESQAETVQDTVLEPAVGVLN